MVEISTKDLQLKDYDQDYSECKGCLKGQKFCERACWPTPQEAKLLIEAGYGDKLMLDVWHNSKDGDTELLCPATPGYETKGAPGRDPVSILESLLGGPNPLRGGCVFQEPETKLCLLHSEGLKPFEGRKSCCKIENGKGLHKAVASSWDTEEARELINVWKEKYYTENEF